MPDRKKKSGKIIFRGMPGHSVLQPDSNRFVSASGGYKTVITRPPQQRARCRGVASFLKALP